MASASPAAVVEVPGRRLGRSPVLRLRRLAALALGLAMIGDSGSLDPSRARACLPRCGEAGTLCQAIGVPVAVWCDWLSGDWVVSLVDNPLCGALVVGISACLLVATLWVCFRVVGL